jgi:ParB family transcriptional regulator, chromosome partitioning protein
MSKNDQRKALGKGLHSLLPTRNTPAATAAAEARVAPALPEPPKVGIVALVPISQVSANPNQPRRDFDATALAELTASIERDGVIQPIVVRRVAPDQYQIIAGERRWRAAQAAGLKEVPVVLREATDEKVLELAIIENIQREDLNPIELALAFQRMGAELGLSHDEIGVKTSKERTTVTNTIRLLQLPAHVQQMIAAKELTAGHARALLTLAGEDAQRSIARQCVDGGWSVRDLEDLTRKLKQQLPQGTTADKKKKPEPSAIDPNVKAAIGEMEAKLGTRVRIIEKRGNKGTIEIEYYSADDLDRIYNAIAGQNE